MDIVRKSPLVSRLDWEFAPPRFALGDPLGGTGGGTRCLDPFNTAGKAISGSEEATVVFVMEGRAVLAAVETGEVMDGDVMCAVTSDRETVE